eukprot:12928619-Alexandrium_andersonii.AAC.1
MSASLVGSEMCIRDRFGRPHLNVGPEAGPFAVRRAVHAVVQARKGSPSTTSRCFRRPLSGFSRNQRRGA